MRRPTLVLGLVLVALLGVAAPTNAAVTGFTTGVQSPVCTHTGAQHGHGKVAAAAYFKESGGTGTNYFKSIAQVQRWNGSAWKPYNPKASRTSTSFPDTNAGYTWSITWKYSFTAHELGHKYRVRLVFQFWDKKSGPDHLLHSTTRYGPTCAE